MSHLDSALIRSGRIDKVIELPYPSLAALIDIFEAHSKLMPLSEPIDCYELFKDYNGMTGADVKSLCTEAGLLAIRDQRDHVTMKDFVEAKNKAITAKQTPFEDGLYL